MYRVARNTPDLLSTSWEWYLSQAVLTITAMTGGGVGYVNVGYHLQFFSTIPV